jgi:hypothetical protein
MTSGGIFILLANDGKQDAMLLDSVGLNQKITQLEIAAQNRTISSPPDTRDISRAGWFNPLLRDFKPLMAIAYEYQSQVSQNTPQWGNDFIVTAPLYGEFINDVYLQFQIDSVTAPNASYWTNPGTSTPMGAEAIAYVKYPGHQMMNNVLFEVNGNQLDRYDTDTMHFYQKFYVPPSKMDAWCNMMGQETVKTGYSYVSGTSKSGATMRSSGVRQSLSFTSGYQTPKPSQPALNLMVPLLFWHCLDPGLSFPSSCVPYGQRNYHIRLPSFSQMVTLHHAFDSTQDNSVPAQMTPNVKVTTLLRNIFVNPTVHQLLVKNIEFTLIRVHLTQSQQVTAPSGRELLQNIKWPVETLHCAFQPVANLSGPYMGETYCMYGVPTPVTVQTGALKNGYTWNATVLTAPLTAAVYTSAFEAFNRSTLDFAIALNIPSTTVLSVAQVNAALVLNQYPALVGPFLNPLTPTPAEIIAATPSPFVESTYLEYGPAVDTVSITAQAVALYNAFAASMYSDYLPYVSVNESMKTPQDPGALLIPFSLYTNIYQPSGYINVSRSREFYIVWTSSYISSATPARLVVVATALNFALGADGSYLLRFAT